jgi:two-component system chemotaxis response regulator CheB
VTSVPPADHRDLVAVGASAGGVEALRALVGGLPESYPGCLLIVLHVPRSAPSALAGILNRSGPLPAGAGRDGEVVRAGRIYVAPADHHLLLTDGHLRLSRGPAENGHRPAVDPLFRSVARAAGRRAVGVVLSGSRDDGAAGLAAIAGRGGTTVVQDPVDALHPWMPRAALDATKPDHVAPAAAIGALLAEITAAPLTPEPAPPPDLLLDAEVAMSASVPPSSDKPAPPAGFGCPTCGGSLFQIAERPIPRFRCRVGHAWPPETLVDEQTEALEGTLWMALRALREKAELSRRMAAGGRGHFVDRAEEAEAAAATLAELIARLDATTSD